jgi:hypothetical protein
MYVIVVVKAGTQDPPLRITVLLADNKFNPIFCNLPGDPSDNARYQAYIAQRWNE